MCIIIQREPNFEIPYDKFVTAVKNNPDGYGISYPDDDKLNVFRTHETPDPDKLYRLVNEELIDKKLMVHLRYTTVGDTILRNAHPFPILERSVDGVDLRMAHNGTLSKYRPKSNISTESDTRVFVRQYVRPLFKRLARGMDPTEILTDPFVKELLEDQLTTASVLTFLDSDGNSLICNPEGNGGKQEEGWYYSNTYSFNSKHREPTQYTPPKVAYSGPKQIEYRKPTSKFKDCSTPRFSTRWGLTSIRDSFKFEDDTIKAICSKPEEAQLLVKELIAELQLSDKGKKK